MNDYVLITGASSGIGASLAESFVVTIPSFNCEEKIS